MGSTFTVQGLPAIFLAGFQIHCFLNHSLIPLVRDAEHTEFGAMGISDSFLVTDLFHPRLSGNPAAHELMPGWKSDHPQCDIRDGNCIQKSPDAAVA